MVAVPQNIEDLFSAIQRRDRAQLMAWLDLFSGPEERYAALRALTESLQESQIGPQRELARWATNLLYQSFWPSESDEPVGAAHDRYEWSERARRAAPRDTLFNHC
jgi:hypothetical protein